MPPLKNVTNKKLPGVLPENNVKAICTRRRCLQSLSKGENMPDSYVKRKAEASPVLKKITKRSAFGDLTNAVGSNVFNVANGKTTLKKAPSVAVKPVTAVFKPGVSLAKPVTTVVKPSTAVAKSSTSNAVKLTSVKPTVVPRKTTRTSLALKSNNVVRADKPPLPKPARVEKPSVSLPVGKPTLVLPAKSKMQAKIKVEETAKLKPETRRSARLSSDLEKSEGSLYMSALDEILDETVPPVPAVLPNLEKTVPPAPAVLPEPDYDFDKETWNDPYQMSMYAYDIFAYLKSREPFYAIKDYMPRQKGLTCWMRSLLIDWLVEVQENFELNHETLYLAVKLVDLYLCKVETKKDTLQLVGAAAMLIAAKYDERIPPMIEDFLYICDGAYKHNDMTKMEVQILKAIDFNLGFPLSYRFLRRYARCTKVQMPLLTLARYILEYSLMEYSTIKFSDSKMAAAALYLALKMKCEGEWNNTLQYYSGYKVEDFKEIALHLNGILHSKPKESLSTVRNKYSHKIFYEVAKTPLIDDKQL